jgi:lariat debranching enzyme
MSLSAGNPPSEVLMQTLKPTYWFSAHHHVKVVPALCTRVPVLMVCQYPALYKHEDGSATKFLALDKCLPGKDFLQIMDLAGAQPGQPLSYDPEWLAILRCATVISVPRAEPCQVHAAL